MDFSAVLGVVLRSVFCHRNPLFAVPGWHAALGVGLLLVPFLGLVSADLFVDSVYLLSLRRCLVAWWCQTGSFRIQLF